MRTLLKVDGFVLVGLIIPAVIPRQRSRFTRQLVSKPWQVPLARFLIMVATPAAVGVLMLPLIGIPVGLMVTLVFPVARYLSQVLVSWPVGEMLSERVGFLRSQNWVLLSLVGVPITTVLAQTPYIQSWPGRQRSSMDWGASGSWRLSAARAARRRERCRWPLPAGGGLGFLSGSGPTAVRTLLGYTPYEIRAIYGYVCLTSLDRLQLICLGRTSRLPHRTHDDLAALRQAYPYDGHWDPPIFQPGPIN